MRVLRRSHESAAPAPLAPDSRPDSRALGLTRPFGLTTRSGSDPGWNRSQNRDATDHVNCCLGLTVCSAFAWVGVVQAASSVCAAVLVAIVLDFFAAVFLVRMFDPLQAAWRRFRIEYRDLGVATADVQTLLGWNNLPPEDANAYEADRIRADCRSGRNPGRRPKHTAQMGQTR